MATLIERLWTGTDGDTWEDVGFVRALGAAFNALVFGNTGHAGATATERVYVVNGFPQTPDVKCSVFHVWADPAGSARYAGIVFRFTQDGAAGYSIELDSNLGVTRGRIRRRNGAAWSDVVAWTALPSSLVDAAALAAGVDLVGRIQNEEGSVNLRLQVGATVLLEGDDASAARWESGGTCGVLIGSTSDTSDVVVDTLRVKDLADEFTGDPLELATDVSIVVDGVPYTWAELVAAGIVVGLGQQSFTDEKVWTFTDTRRLGDADSILYVGAVVSVAGDGDVVAFGILADADQAIDPAEGRTYALVGPKGLAADVLIDHPVTHAPTIAFNLPEGHPDFDAQFAGLNVGQMIALLLELHVDGDGNLRDQGAAPPDGNTPAFVQVELDALTAKVFEVEVSGDVYTAVESLLAFTKFACWIDPATRIWHFFARDAGPIVDVDLATAHVVGTLRTDRSRNATRILFRGQRPQTQIETFLYDETDPGGSTAAPGWPDNLEATHDFGTKYKNRDTGLVLASGTVGGDGTITVDPVGPPVYAQEAHEWIGGQVGFADGPEAGENYDLRDNTPGEIIIKGAWKHGGPVLGNTFAVQGNGTGGGRDNGHRILGRRFELVDAGKGIPSDACAQIKITLGKAEAIAKGFVYTPDDPAEPASIVSDLPAISIFNFPQETKADPCVPGDAPAYERAKVEITVPTYDRADPRVPTKLWPAVGFRGTAFTRDAAKWNGGGKPGKGDAKVMRTLPFNLPRFKGTALEATALEKIGDDLLALVGTLAREVRIVLGGVLDWSWAGLNRRVTLSHSGGRTTGLENATDLFVLAVEWDVFAKTTTIVAGIQALGGPYDIEGLRRALAVKFGAESQERVRADIGDLLACIQGSRTGAGAVGEQSPEQICAEQVTSSKKEPGSSVSRDLAIIWLELIGILKNLGKTVDDGGNVLTPGTVVGPGGATVYGPGGAVALAGGSMVPPTTIGGILSNLGKTVGPTGQVLAPGTVVPAGGATLYGPNGAVPLGVGSTVPPTTIGGILANLGKTVDNATGAVLVPGTVVGGGGATNYGPNGANPLGVGSTVPPTTIGGILSNLGKTVDNDTGSVLAPGTVVGGGGATLFGPNGAVPLGSGSTVPPTTIGGILANLGKTVSNATGAVLAAGSVVGAGGANFYGPGGAIPLAPGATVPPTTLGGLAANKAALETTCTGLIASVDAGNAPNVTAPDGSVYGVAASGFTLLAGTGLAGPQLGGAIGGLAGKCGSTMSGAGAFGSGPGTILEPGTAVDADGAYYYPPTDDPADVVQLAAADEVPANSGQQARALLRGGGELQAVDLADPGGVVYASVRAPSEGPGRFYRVEPSTVRCREVESTPAIGLNGGDWSWIAPAVYFEARDVNTWKPPVLLATDVALPGNAKSGTTLLAASANGPLPAIDGVAAGVSDRVLVKNEADTTKAGLYVVTDAGSGATPWVLTRADDYATPDEALGGAIVVVLAGGQAGRVFQQTALGVVPHTDPQTWGPFGGISSVGSDAGWTAPSGITPTRNGVTAATTHNQLLAIVAGLQNAFLAFTLPQP